MDEVQGGREDKRHGAPVVPEGGNWILLVVTPRRGISVPSTKVVI
jgi:hypothetical protein